ncbi:nucleotidyltransferase [Tenacibaculum maritimum]|nr:nucleotidyltransferase [Tenacibaculum maritimum]MDB0603198.1 nucleotidyltransferase [Tenacibaculum maritimum]MDB0610460.1 nucleotidyltransferase [Tenacibaculum maritimum]
MARTRTEIKNQITSSFVNNEIIRAAYGLTEGLTFEQQFSLVSFENILFDIISFSILLLEQLFNQHTTEVDDKLYNQKSGRLPWYRYMALKFQYGFNLLTNSDEFDSSGATAEQIEASKIIKYAAVNEGDVQGTIIVKIAGESDGVLAPISEGAQTSVEAYFQEIKYAGSRIRIINYLHDRLFLNLQIFRDPLVLDENGVSILNGNKPVEEAINAYMKELPFDGELELESLIDKLQLVQGVITVNLINASSSWITPTTGGYGLATPINIKRIPESGYYKVENFDTVAYVV